MLRPEIDWKICQVCEPCEACRACATRAVVKIDSDDPPYIEFSRCNGCGDCVIACTFQAIMLKNGWHPH